MSGMVGLRCGHIASRMKLPVPLPGSDVPLRGCYLMTESRRATAAVIAANYTCFLTVDPAVCEKSTPSPSRRVLRVPPLPAPPAANCCRGCRRFWRNGGGFVLRVPPLPAPPAANCCRGYRRCWLLLLLVMSPLFEVMFVAAFVLTFQPRTRRQHLAAGGIGESRWNPQITAPRQPISAANAATAAACR